MPQRPLWFPLRFSDNISENGQYGQHTQIRISKAEIASK